MKTNNRSKRIKITSVLVGLAAAMALTSTRTAQAQTWTRKADMPTARHLTHTSVVAGKIYIIGALEGAGLLTKLEAYDPATDTWAAKADMPTGRTFFATSVVDGKLYVMGGEAYWHGPTLATVEAYDPVTDTWTKKADMPAPRGELAASVVNGKIYAIGGLYFDGEREVSTVEVYDPATDAWTRKTDMPTARAFMTTSVVNGQIYAIGGQTAGGGPSPAFSSVEAYDPVTDTWTRKADILSPRTGSGASVVNGKIYVFGGRDERASGVPRSTVFQYDPVTDIWTALDDMPVRMGGMGVSTVGWKIYIMGGSSALIPFTPYLSTVWEYDPAPSPDFNGDGIVDGADISIMVDHWHTDASRYDIAPPPFGDGIVDVQDLILLSEHLFEEIFPFELVAYWKFDETEGDVAYNSTSDNHGILADNPTWQPDSGLIAGALEFDGIDDYVETDFVLDPADGAFSVFAWIKGGAPGQVIISQMHSIFSGEIWLGIGPVNGCLMTGLVSPPFGRFMAEPLESDHIITDNIWYHIGFVWDGSYRTLYVDGIEVAKDANLLTSLNNSDGGLYIGVNKNLDAGTYFSGLIDDVRIYNRAVSPQLIETLAQ